MVAVPSPPPGPRSRYHALPLRPGRLLSLLPSEARTVDDAYLEPRYYLTVDAGHLDEGTYRFWCVEHVTGRWWLVDNIRHVDPETLRWAYTTQRRRLLTAAEVAVAEAGGGVIPRPTLSAIIAALDPFSDVAATGAPSVQTSPVMGHEFGGNAGGRRVFDFDDLRVQRAEDWPGVMG